MNRFTPFLALAALAICGCSSTGIYDLQQRGASVSTPPRQILIAPFTVRTEVLQLGERSQREKASLGREISASLARKTVSDVQRYAAPAALLSSGRNPGVGTWLVRGEILEVDQGSRALRTGVGLGMGQTRFRTRVTVSEVTHEGLRPLLAFRTTGTSGLEPGGALGVIGGVGAAQAAGGLVLAGLPGVSSDIDRTAYEIAAVLSAYLSRNGMLSPSRQALTPNLAGQLPTTVNTRRIVPAPLRDTFVP